MLLQWPFLTTSFFFSAITLKQQDTSKIYLAPIIPSSQSLENRNPVSLKITETLGWHKKLDKLYDVVSATIEYGFTNNVLKRKDDYLYVVIKLHLDSE